MITVQLEDNGPITLMDENQLRRVDGLHDDDREYTTFVEYWHGNRCVHRSVHVHLKQGLSLTAEQGAFGG